MLKNNILHSILKILNVYIKLAEINSSSLETYLYTSRNLIEN